MKREWKMFRNCSADAGRSISLQKYELIESIPNSLLMLFYHEKEVTVTGLCQEYIRFRLDRKPVERKASLVLKYLDYQKQCFETVIIREAEIVKTADEEFWTEVCVEIPETCSSYKQAFSFVTRQYMHYVQCKMEMSGNDFSKELCRYPAEQDAVLEQDLNSFWEQRMRESDYDRLLGDMREQGVEIAGCLDRYPLYERLVQGDPLLEKQIAQWDRIYVGNSFCIMQCPDLSMWEVLFRIAVQRGYRMTMVVPPISENRIEEMKEWIALCVSESRMCQKIDLEIVVNDWGTLDYLTKIAGGNWRILAGELLLKGRRDPRRKYRIGMRDIYDEGQQDSVWMQKILMKQGLSRVEVSGLCSARTVTGGEESIRRAYHAPLYQTNTSSFCTMKALIEQKDRGKQSQTQNCPRYCDQFFMAYPKHLSMIGIGNSLFGFHLPTAERIAEWKIDRFVYNGLIF